MNHTAVANRCQGPIWIGGPTRTGDTVGQESEDVPWPVDAFGGCARVNLWRSVHLTPETDDALARRQMTATAEVLRPFIAIYVERELGRELTRRRVSHHEKA